MKIGGGEKDLQKYDESFAFLLESESYKTREQCR